MKPSRDELYDLYWNQLMSLNAIGKLLGRDPSTIADWFKQFGIPTRPRGTNGSLKIQLQDLSGKRFTRLKVIKRLDARRLYGTFWLCLCDCGSEIEVRGQSLRSGNTRSCGCLARELSAAAATKHGLSTTRTHKIWRGMLDRATNPRAGNAKNYVLRGIGVCDRWLSFENFYEDMGPAPDGLTLERVDNEKGYGPDNCIWATDLAQRRNKRPPRGLPPGVYQAPSGRWSASISVMRRLISLGTFDSFDAALAARKEAERELWTD